MEHGFWHRKWKENEIGFHENDANHLLVAYLNELAISNGGRVFVPLCGKTLDIAWLIAKGFQVAAIELSELAVEQLFENLGTKPDVAINGELKHYRAPALDIFVGDVFNLTGEILGPIDAVYDRAAFVALPDDMRLQYSEHVSNITARAPQLLITFEYDQRIMPGPPFSITTEEVHRHYDEKYQITNLDTVDVVGGLKGKCPATESAWILRRK